MKTFLLVPLLLACGVLHLHAADTAPAAEKPATMELLDVMRFEEVSVDAAVAGFDGMMDQMKQNGVPPKAIAEIRAEARKLYVRIFNSPDLKKKVAGLYDKHFTHDEILQLTEFYRSPLGQKTLTGVPSIMKDVMDVAMPALQKEMNGFQQKIAEIIEKHEPKAAPDEEEEKEEPADEKEKE